MCDHMAAASSFSLLLIKNANTSSNCTCGIVKFVSLLFSFLDVAVSLVKLALVRLTDLSIHTEMYL